MSYVHCPRCSHAFNLASQAGCPSCGTQELMATDPAEAIIAAAEQLARAMARATPEQLETASAAMERRWRVADDTQPSILTSIRAALRPASPVVTGPAKQALLATVVMAVLTRLPRKPVFGLRNAARALLTR